MIKSLDEAMDLGFDINSANASSVRESTTVYSTGAQPVDALESYSCDAGCKNCHCASY